MYCGAHTRSSLCELPALGSRSGRSATCHARGSRRGTPTPSTGTNAAATTSMTMRDAMTCSMPRDQQHHADEEARRRHGRLLACTQGGGRSGLARGCERRGRGREEKEQARSVCAKFEPRRGPRMLHIFSSPLPAKTPGGRSSSRDACARAAKARALAEGRARRRGGLGGRTEGLLPVHARHREEGGRPRGPTLTRISTDWVTPIDRSSALR